jgi:DNA invertase Pin-like site-specific DNA recombinase
LSHGSANSSTLEFTTPIGSWNGQAIRQASGNLHSRQHRRSASGDAALRSARDGQTAGYEIVHEYSDTISGAKSKRPGLDQLMADARRHRFDIVLVAAFDRVARSVRHFLEVLDELNHLGIEFVSFRENIDTGGPLGRAMIVIVSAIAELERSLIVERVRAGMRRAKLEGRRIGRAPLDIDREQVVRDRRSGMSLRQVAEKHGISRASVCRLVKESGRLADRTAQTTLAA